MTAKKTTSRAKKGPTPAKPVQAAGGPFEPIRINTSQPVEEKRETLFVLEEQPVLDDNGRPVLDEDGQPRVEDVEYTIPVKVRPKFAIQVLRDLRTGDETVVIANAVHSVLGSEAMNALAECDHVTEEQIGQIIRIVGDRIRGATSDLTTNF